MNSKKDVEYVFDYTKGRRMSNNNLGNLKKEEESRKSD